MREPYLDFGIIFALTACLFATVGCKSPAPPVYRSFSHETGPVERPEPLLQPRVPRVIVISFRELALPPARSTQKDACPNPPENQYPNWLIIVVAVVGAVFGVIAAVFAFVRLLFLLVERLARGPHKELAKKVEELEKILGELQNQLARSEERDKLLREWFQMLQANSYQNTESRIYGDDTPLLPFGKEDVWK